MLEINGRQNFLQLLWCNLLLGVAPCFVRIVMRFDHQAVQSKVDCSLGCFQKTGPAPHDMAWIIDDFHAFPLVFQENWKRPVWLVSEPLVVSVTETPVNVRQLGNAHGM